MDEVREPVLKGQPPRLSARAVRTGASPINELMVKMFAEPDLISLAAGFVDNDTLPVETMQTVVEALLSDVAAARAALQYGTTAGLGTLRQQLVDRLAAADGREVGTGGYDVERMVVGTGSQQLLYLLSEVLLDPDDIVILSHPSYFVFMDALRSSGVSCRAVPLDEEGMRADRLEALLKTLAASGELSRVRFVYLVSYFQNPTGISVSPRRRREIFDLVQRFGADNGMLLIEDAAYRELRYDVDDVSSIRALDEDGETVVYLGTFSKSFSPGLKTGYGLFPKTLAEHVVNLKGAHDFGSGNFAQHVLERVLRGGRYDRHVERLRRTYRRRRDVMVQTLDETMPAGVVRTDPQGGLYVWLTLPEGVETGADAPLFEASLARGMLYVPGEFCFAATTAGGDVPRNCLRLSFGVGALDAIAEGVKRLAAAVREVMASTRTGAT